MQILRFFECPAGVLQIAHVIHEITIHFLFKSCIDIQYNYA